MPEPWGIDETTSMRPLAAAALAGAARILALAAGPVASASADNWNIRRDWLRFPAPVNYTNCKLRHIQLPRLPAVAPALAPRLASEGAAS
jgi:hypothetical protein